MLSGHPYINHAYVREAYTPGGRLVQQLVVETSLKDPRSGDTRDLGEWSMLYETLSALTANGFTDITNIDMRGRGE